MAAAAIGRSTCETGFATKHLTLLRGGPAAACHPEHSHPEAQVSVRFGPKGKGKGRDPVELNLYASHQSHSVRWNKGWHVVVWRVSHVLLEQAADELGVRGRIEVIPIDCGRDELLEAMGRSLLGDFPSVGDGGPMFVGSMAAFLAGYLVRRHCDVRAPHARLGRLTEPEMGRLNAFIDERMETGFDVVELARWAGLPPQPFAERLRLTTGLAPWGYVQRYRISMACRLLKDGRISLAEIANRLGFASQSHFTNAFRSRMQMTPGAYRKLL